jgi:hypothetical protein
MRADKYYVVDRVQEDVAVLMGDDGDEVAHPVYRLRCQVGEGTVLRVPLGRDGQPEFLRAVVDEAERKRRKDAAGGALGELRKRDRGGDVTT